MLLIDQWVGQDAWAALVDEIDSRSRRYQGQYGQTAAEEHFGPLVEVAFI